MVVKTASRRRAYDFKIYERSIFACWIARYASGTPLAERNARLVGGSSSPKPLYVGKKTK